MKTSSLILIVAAISSVGCSSGYQTENGSVYWHGWDESVGRKKELVPGAEASTFEVLEHGTYGRDSKSCFFKTEPIPKADPSSFESLSNQYAKDEQNAYCGSQLIPRSDGASFGLVTSEWEKWSKDKNRCYCGTEVIDGADPSSFRVIGGHLNSWAADSDSYFYNHAKVPLNDLDSFVILDYGFSKDKTAVYYQANIVPGADAQTFRMIDGTSVGKDKNSHYRFGKRFQPPP